jgi:hypothetical protein
METFIGTMLVLSFIANIALGVIVVKGWMSKTAETARIEKQAQEDADAKKQDYIDSLVKAIATLKDEIVELKGIITIRDLNLAEMRKACECAAKMVKVAEAFKPSSIGAGLGKLVKGAKNLSNGVKDGIHSASEAFKANS